MLRIGIDMGGTFTDFVTYDEHSGKISLNKTPTSKARPWEPIISYISNIASTRQDIIDIRHGTTVGVNAVIQRAESTTGLLTTEGFRDILEIGRQKRPHLYNLRAAATPPLIPRNLRLTVRERISAEGVIKQELDEAGVKKAAGIFKKMQVKSAAILFLHSYINDIHEKKAAEILKKELPGIFITTSSEVISQFREYERLSATVLNAYLKPVMVAYLEKLFKRIEETGSRAPFYISQSDGGITSAGTAIQLPVRTLYSGPSAGAVGCAFFYGKQNPSLISLDMGGTSTDLTLISSQQPVTTTGKTAAGYPFLFPAIDIKTVGAGGGSIAGIDEGGFLQVGPSSAGSDPGPACYGKGGKMPTLTDASLILGTLGINSMLGGKIKLDKARAERAIEEHVSKPLNIPVQESAESIIRLVVSNIANSIRKISVMKGIHPQDLKLVAYGGSGPMHAADIARELGIGEVIVPLNPGVFSALGLLCSKLTMDFVKTVKGLSAEKITASAAELEEKGRLWFMREKIPPRIQKTDWSLDLRYRGQNYEINIPLSGPGDITDYGALAETFHQKHSQLYGHFQKHKEVETVNLRLKCLGLIPTDFRKKSRPRTEAKNSLKEKRIVYFTQSAGPVNTPVLHRSRIAEQTEIKGPAILEDVDSTTVMGPKDSARVGKAGDLLIKVGAS
ncbi:MAG: hydantoinase/oxoprolinase family protein [Actinomycetota bacterium]